jgi:DNA-binding NtrC family response regulator
MSRSRILVIDDEPSVTDALGMILSGLGHHVDTAKSGAEAKALLKGSAYDLVFTDLRLPDASGIDLLTLIKSDTATTEVVVMTAHGSIDITIEAIKRGAFYYIEKPFTPHQVTTLVERAAIRRCSKSMPSSALPHHLKPPC